MRKEQQFRRIAKKYHAYHSEWVVMIGPAHSGKSTLFNTLLDQRQDIKYDPDLEIDNIDER